METIIINRSKLKIMLTPPDMQKYAIAAEPPDFTDDATRRALRRIIEDARQGTDFVTDGHRLLIQLYASRDGGCEIFVTRLGEEEPSPDTVPDIVPEDFPDAAPDAGTPEQALLRRIFTPGAPVGQVRTGTRPAALLLPDVDCLTAVCGRLMSVGYAEESRAYILEDGRYCLLLRLPDTSFFRLPQPYAFLAEYGETADAGVTGLLVCEHARTVCPTQAVETLGRL